WSVPEGTELGINYKSWQVGSCFQGVKMIPPGLHFLHYCSSNAPDLGSEICLANWDPKEEDLDISASQNEEVGWVWVGLQDLDPFLGPYQYELMYKCVSLTAWVNQEITREEQNLPRNDKCQTMKEEQDRLHRMKPRDGTELRFSPIPRQTYCSLHLCIFSLGPCTYEGFEHGKHLLALLCRSESPALYLGLIAVLYQQLGEIPTDFSVDIVSQDNYLTSTLQDFFQFASGPGVDGTLQKRAEKFKAHLTTEVDPDDCDPVVVLLPERITLD
uniref:Protein AAR2 homolog n=1 Tax=Oncorhynchus mykiss TaxID=8022 RepID=A0A8K9UUL1_ONCMY